MEGTSGLSGLVTLLAVLFLIVLIILWILMPFLIMGTNRRLDRVINLLDENNNLVNMLASEAERSMKSPD